MTKRLLNFMGGEKKFDEGTLGPSLATCNDHKWPAGIGESLPVSIGYSIFRLSSSYSIFNIHHQTSSMVPAWSSASGVTAVSRLMCITGRTIEIPS